MQITKIETLEQYNKFKDEFNKINKNKYVKEYKVFIIVDSYETVIDSYTLFEEWERNGRYFDFEKTLYKLEKLSNEINNFFYKYRVLFGYKKGQDLNEVDIVSYIDASILMSFFWSPEKNPFSRLCRKIGVNHSIIEKTELSKITTIPIKITKTKSL